MKITTKEWLKNYQAEQALNDVEFKIKEINNQLMKLEAVRTAYNEVRSIIIRNSKECE